jgi:hypothetical protein
MNDRTCYTQQEQVCCCSLYICSAHGIAISSVARRCRFQADVTGVVAAGIPRCEDPYAISTSTASLLSTGQGSKASGFNFPHGWGVPRNVESMMRRGGLFRFRN